MSNITSIIFSFSSLEDENREVKIIDFINKSYFLINLNWQFTHKSDLLGETYLANFNYFELGILVDILRNISWEYPEDVRLYRYSEMMEDGFETIDILPIHLTDGYYPRDNGYKSSIPEKYISSLFNTIEIALASNHYKETTFIMHTEVWKFITIHPVFNGKYFDNKFTVAGYDCKVIPEDNSIDNSIEVTLLSYENIFKSPILYYRNY